jgi:hypothetical protein
MTPSVAYPLTPSFKNPLAKGAFKSIVSSIYESTARANMGNGLSFRT